MKTYVMSQVETLGWENGDARLRDAWRFDVRCRASALTPRGTTVEIYTCDGLVADVIKVEV